MKLRSSKSFSVAVLVVAALVIGLSIVQTIRQDNFDPILQIAWLPAVFAGASYRRSGSGTSCVARFAGKSRS